MTVVVHGRISGWAVLPIALETKMETIWLLMRFLVFWKALCSWMLTVRI